VQANAGDVAATNAAPPTPTTATTATTTSNSVRFRSTKEDERTVRPGRTAGRTRFEAGGVGRRGVVLKTCLAA
jgi:hypothetical protein